MYRRLQDTNFFTTVICQSLFDVYANESPFFEMEIYSRFSA